MRRPERRSNVDQKHFADTAFRLDPYHQVRERAG